MKKVGTIIYTSLVLIIFLALFLATGLLLYNKYTPQQEKSRQVMEDLRARAFSWQKGLFNSDVFTSYVEYYFESNERLLNITLYSPGEGVLATFSRAGAPPGGYLKDFKNKPDWQPRTWKGQPVYGNLPFFGFGIYTKPIYPDLNPDYMIAGVFQVISYQEIFSIISYTFMILLVSLIVSVIVRLFVSDQTRSGEPGYFFSDDKQQTEENAAWQGEPGSDETEDQDPLQEYAEKGEETAVPEEALPPHGQESETTYKHVEKDQVRNLFSPRTGMGWENHLAPRLKSEIKRTASFDQDMSFALISIENPEELRDPEAISIKLAKIILDLFLFQDLSFEYGRSGFAVILPDMGLEDAIREMEVLQRKVSSSQICSQFVNINIGLTARNGRLVSEDELLKEAGKALEIASGDKTNNIIAFNPDPEKYRALVSRQL